MGDRPLRFGVIALCAAAALSWGAAKAEAAQGDLLYQDCLTGDTNVGPAGSNACSLAGMPTMNGINSGLNRAWAVSVSPDGANVYALAQEEDAIVRFSRNASTGALTFQDCLTGQTAVTACTPIGATATMTGADSGFDQPYGIVISPNGASVYVTTVNDDSVVRFDRNTGTGVLTYQGCFTGETATGHLGGNSSCTAIPSHTVGGDNSGLEKLRAIAIDPNGETVYASAPADDSIARFTRDMAGALTYQTCFTAELATGPMPMGNGSCAALPGITGVGSNSGFDNPQAIAVSPNGASVYVASGNDASITRFGRTAVTGVLAHQECVSRETESTTCTLIAGHTTNGLNSGLDNLRAVIVSPDGASLYTVAGFDASIAHFTRHTGTGALTFQGCVTGESQIGAGGTNKCTTQIASATAGGEDSGWSIGSIAPALAINAAGTGVYFAALSDRSVVQLDRDTGTGALSPRRCLTSETESINAVCAGISPSASLGMNTALQEVNSLALSPDGSSIYTAAFSSDAIARFALEGPPAPPVVNPPVLTPAAPAKKKCKKGRKLKKGKCVKKKRKKKPKK